MINELAEVGIPRRDAGVFFVVLEDLCGVFECSAGLGGVFGIFFGLGHHLLAQRAQRFFWPFGRRQGTEHAPKATFELRASPAQLGATNATAVG